MKSKDYWQLFWETGAPEAYMMYTQALKTEGTHVPDDTGNRPESNGIQ